MAESQVLHVKVAARAHIEGGRNSGFDWEGGFLPPPPPFAIYCKFGGFWSGLPGFRSGFRGPAMWIPEFEPGIFVKCKKSLGRRRTHARGHNQSNNQK
jgi:hypothetical protein